jgi:hypothetical protein
MDNLGFAKILNETGNACGRDKDDFHREIEKRAEATRVAGQSQAQAYSKYLETPEGNELYKAYRAAPAPKQAPQDFVPEPPLARGPAAAKLQEIVDKFLNDYNEKNSRKISREQAYERVISSESHRALRAAVLAEERAASREIRDQRAPIWSAGRDLERDWSLGRSRGSARM